MEHKLIDSSIKIPHENFGVIFYAIAIIPFFLIIFWPFLDFINIS